MKFLYQKWVYYILWFLTFSITSNASVVNHPRFYQSSQDMMLLNIDKSTLRAKLSAIGSMNEYLYRIADFQIAIGKESGDKFVEGDNKTPEGIYFTGRHIDPSRLLQSKYGPGAIPLNFPNPFDKFQKKTGYGIWLHGAGNDKRMADKQVTEGCVAFLNNDILKLQKWIQPGASIVVVSDNASKINTEEDVKKITALTHSWLSSWKNKDAKDFASHYDANFILNGRTKDAYRDYKAKLFDRYNKMDVMLFDLFVITHPKYAVSVFNQNFNGDGFISNGRKVLYWTKTANNEWKILREVFENGRFKKLPYLTASDQRKNLIQKIESTQPSQKLVKKIEALPVKL